MISAIIVAAIIFSFLIYQYYIKNSSQVQSIAVEQIQNTTLVKVSDLTNLLQNKLDLVAVNLEILSSSQELINQQTVPGKMLLNSAQKTTANIVDFYNWVDRNGTIIWSTPNVHDNSNMKFKEFATAARPYIEKAKDIQSPVYTNIVKLTDGESGILLVYPIIDTQNGTVNKSKRIEDFKGAVWAGISSDTLTQFLKGQLSQLPSANLSLIDSSGKIMLTEIPNLMSSNVFDKKFNSLPRGSGVDNKGEKTMVDAIKSAIINRKTGTTDIESGGNGFTISYSPVISRGIHYFTAVLFLPHTLASKLDDLVVQQRNFAIVAMVIIVLSALGIFFVITYWNKGLRKVVYIQTKELEETTRKLTYHDRLQKEFIDIAAHEFRTPIQSVLGYSEMIHTNLKNFDQYFDKIIRNAKRLEKLTEDILDVSRIEGKNFQLTNSTFDLNQTIQQVIEDHQKEALDRGVKIIFELKKQIPAAVYGDEARLQQVINNLLSNAISFTNNGTVTISVYIAQIDSYADNDNLDKESIVVEVRDTGTGINPEIVPRLFEKFATKSVSGTGLGLYISKSIVDGHGGKIWAYNNEDGKGATFTFSIPINDKNNKK